MRKRVTLTFGLKDLESSCAKMVEICFCISPPTHPSLGFIIYCARVTSRRGFLLSVECSAAQSAALLLGESRRTNSWINLVMLLQKVRRLAFLVEQTGVVVLDVEWQ